MVERKEGTLRLRLQGIKSTSGWFGRFEACLQVASVGVDLTHLEYL